MNSTTTGRSELSRASQLASIEFFRNLGPAAIDDLAAEVEPVALARAEVLLRQGDPGDGMYVLLNGRLRVEIENPDGSRTQVDELEAGATIGEMALLTGQDRAATVWAAEPSELARISRSGADRLMARHPQVRAEFDRILVPRLRRIQLSAVLSRLFGDLDVPTAQDLQSRLEWRHLAGGETAFQQGEPGNAMMIVVNGCLKLVRRDPDGGDQVEGEYRRGSYVAGYVLLTGEVYRETALAVRDSDVVLLSQGLFVQLVEAHPGAVLQIARVIAQQQSSIGARNRDAEKAINLALVAVSPGVPLTRFARRLDDSFAGLGSSLHLSSGRFDVLYGRTGAAQTEPGHPIDSSIVAWLSEREAGVDHVIYEADPEWTPWTQRCLRQADRILFVAEADDETGLSPLEIATDGFPVRARRELALIQHDGIERPTGTRQWLSARRVTQHHHVRMGNDADFRRLARRLTGRATGLALSGGAARGIAHLGVYRALLEAGVEIDMVGGTSMGALLGAGIVAYESVEAMNKLSKVYLSKKALLDQTLPVTAMYETRKINQVLQKLFGATQIEDLWRPFFCISSNLSRSEMVVHRSGDLWRAVRASIAIPGVFAPLCQDGDILVDGGSMNNLPIDVMREECEGGTVIGVDANPAKERGRSWDFEPSVSGWRVLWSKINPFARPLKVPMLFETLVRATVMNSRYRLRFMREQADLLIEPETGQFASMDWSRHQEIAEVGYQAALAKLETWSRVPVR